MTEHVGFSVRRIWQIAGNTFTESLRQKVYNILLIFALVVIASASFFAQFAVGEDITQTASYELKSIKDTCFGALSVIGMLIAVVGTAMTSRFTAVCTWTGVYCPGHSASSSFSKTALSRIVPEF